MRLPAFSAATSLALVSTAVAQTPGLPLHGASMPSGVHIAATVGWTGASHWVGDAFTLGATLGYAGGRVGLAGTVGRIDPDAELGENQLALGALGSLRVFGGTLDTPLEVDLLGGFGWKETPDNEVTAPPTPERADWHAQGGVGLTLDIATAIMSIRPWVAPRAEVFTESTGTGTNTVTRFAGSAGVDLRFLGGFGLRAMWDKVDGDDQAIGFGLSYRF